MSLERVELKSTIKRNKPYEKKVDGMWKSVIFIARMSMEFLCKTMFFDI
jgi:hypothetical protein